MRTVLTLPVIVLRTRSAAVTAMFQWFVGMRFPSTVSEPFGPVISTVPFVR